MKRLILLGILGLMSSISMSAFAQYGEPTVALVSEVQNDEGEVLLADSLGKTLYVFDVDLGTPTSQCVGDCAEVWPPYIITAEEAQTLVSPLGSVARTNGKLQLTRDGRPLYTYIFDRAKGDELGEGIGGVWHYIEIE